MSIIIVSVPS